jgi:UDP-glucose 4-epimerase
MRYLLIGGAGFIGSHLADLLCQMMHEVVIVDNFSTGRIENINHHRENPKFKMSRGTNEYLVDRICQADCTFLLAASIGVSYFEQNPTQSMLNNLDLEQKVFSIAEKHQKKIIYFSTSEVYGNTTGGKAKEDQIMQIGNPTKPRWGYACSKLMGEFLINSYTFPSIIVRPFNIVGPRQLPDYGMVLPNFIEKAKRGETIEVYGNGNQVRCFCSVHEAAHVFYKLALDRNIHKDTFNIGNSDNEIKMRDLAELVKEMTNSNSHIEFRTDVRSDADIFYRVPDTRKIENAVGWKAKKTITEIIRELI